MLGSRTPSKMATVTESIKKRSATPQMRSGRKFKAELSVPVFLYGSECKVYKEFFFF